MFLEILPEACNFIKKEILTQVFSCEFCEIFKNTFFTERLQTTAFVKKIVKNIKEQFKFNITGKSNELFEKRPS